MIQVGVAPSSTEQQAASDQAMLGGAQLQTFRVPRKIRLMSQYIHERLKAVPSLTRLELPIDVCFLKIVIDYCAKYDYLKVMSTLMFPAAHNQLQKNVTYHELQPLDSIGSDLEGLKKLLVYCKKLKIEALYELTCCAIACFFKSRPNSYFAQERVAVYSRQQQS